MAVGAFAAGKKASGLAALVAALLIGSSAAAPARAQDAATRARGADPGTQVSRTEGDSRADAGTRIYDSVPLGREVCTLTILGGDLVCCAGAPVTVGAELECGEDYVPVQDPQWYLGSEYLGAGMEITFAPGVGTHALTASCGSCEDAIEILVLDEADCYGPRLDVLFADDEIEAAGGVFLQVNQSSVPPAAFGYCRYLMRPVVLSANELVPEGSIELAASGGNLEVYRRNGNAISLPASFAVAALPETLLMNATALGAAVLSATYAGGEGGRELPPDEVRVRVGLFPGLAGGTLSGYPFFEFVAAVNNNDVLSGALDPVRHAERAGLPYRAYVVSHRSPQAWALDNTLTDASGGYETASVTAGSIADDIVTLWSAGLAAGSLVGEPYDVVYDFGLDGRLDPGDLIDGLSEAEAGVYLVRDLNLIGPHSTVMIQYSGGTMLGQRTYYPADIAGMGQLPLVVISHGNGHNYTWYDYLGYHLASYGYIVMAHQNNTQPGIETASTTTLTNTDYIIGNQATIGGGVLNGHLDSHRITWIGHSRGGEGVVRAYDRIYDGTYVPSYFTLSDIVCVSSIAPTVYLSTVEVNSHLVTYHMLYGAADGDVNGGCNDGDRQSLRYAEAAEGNVQVTYVQGADHNDFNCCGFDDGEGPNLIGRAEAQRVAKSYYLALIEHYVRGNAAARDYLTRMYAGFHPSGIAAQVVCANTYRDALATDRFVIDNCQTNTSPGMSSSGGAVSYDVSNIHEGRLDDGDLVFTWLSSDPMNGMTRTDTGVGYEDIYQGGMVFDWTTGQQRFCEFEIVSGRRDFREHVYLSFRACQGTRHPETVGLNGPLTFTVTLRDAQGATSSIHFGGYGSITRPYQRTGLGTGAGWANEFNTVRIRLADFENDGSGIDLSAIVAVRLEFGSESGSARGRIGIDDLELTRN